MHYEFLFYFSLHPKDSKRTGERVSQLYQYHFVKVHRVMVTQFNKWNGMAQKKTRLFKNCDEFQIMTIKWNTD